ncbi:ADF-H domain-containing protein [Plasmodiophora brassicae]|uniref:ADF-H domain-containing protein n=1 Tax=Plasmodiophora brassicae TaxID=37360 RepID=A0A0G4J7Y6_PLABS|nr:hypothetical protein PBRA_009482 [Plasmodiophora brassicae]SPQ97017.1 unnamed protein product [Plasmodiophora brassicae]
MVSAGLKTDEECMTLFNELKLRKKYKYIVYAILDNTITIESKLPGEAPFQYANFVKLLSAANEPRFAVLDYNYEEEGVQRSKIVFVFWCPDSTKTRDKMMYASAKEDFQKKLTGLHKIKQVNDESDLDEAEMLALCKQ